MKRLLLVGTLLALTAATTASAATSPAKYRTTMNGICRAYTPRLKVAQDAMALATTSQRKPKFEAALERYLLLRLQQARQLEAVHVPGSLQKPMGPVIKLLKKIDPHLFLALRSTRHGDLKAARWQMKTVTRISVPLNGTLDAAGLLDCGSNQP